MTIAAGPSLAILGATGHIGKGLTAEFAGAVPLMCYVRDRRKMEAFIDSAGLSRDGLSVLAVDAFADCPAEVAVNCIGVGDPARIRDLGAGIFRLTERFDDAVLDWLDADPARLYVNMSSGAVYGTDFAEPAAEDSCHTVPVNALGPARFYAVAKLNAEAKHRARADRSIVDLRVFSYFSRFIDLDGGFLLADAMKALIADDEMTTRPDAMTRDHVVPADLAALVRAMIERRRGTAEPLNAVLDVHSQAPVGKFALLDAMKRELGLRYRVDGDLDALAPTGGKSEYYSTRRVDPAWGYRPRHDSITGVLAEARALLAATR